MTFNEESAQIRDNRKKPEASKQHKFKAAEWTHPNGHPRCLICGDEENLTGTCNDDRAVPTQEIGKVAEPEIKYMDIRDIYPNPWNRKLKREKIDAIKTQIRDLGQIKPLVITEVDRRGKKAIVVTDGHHRLEALKEIRHVGKIPVVWADERGIDTASGIKPKTLKKNIMPHIDLRDFAQKAYDLTGPNEQQAAGRQDVPQHKMKQPESNTTSFKSMDILRNMAGEFSKVFGKMAIEAPVDGLSLTREDLGIRKPKKKPKDGT